MGLKLFIIFSKRINKYYVVAGYQNVYPAWKENREASLKLGLPVFFSLPDKHSNFRHQHNICYINRATYKHTFMLMWYSFCFFILRHSDNKFEALWKLKPMRNSTDDNLFGGLRVKQNRLIFTQTYQHGQNSPDWYVVPSKASKADWSTACSILWTSRLLSTDGWQDFIWRFHHTLHTCRHSPACSCQERG